MTHNIDIDSIVLHSGSDMSLSAKRFFATAFMAAHTRHPLGVSFEIGTRTGGSAHTMLALLDELYPTLADVDKPVVISADPYGCKPYDSGMGFPPAGIYGAHAYVSMKRAMAPRPNHLFYYMRGEDALRLLPQAELWYAGARLSVRDMTFVLLDGAHDAPTIATEAQYAAQLGSKTIFVDNASADPNTLEAVMTVLGSGYKLDALRKDATAAGDDQAVFVLECV